MPAMPPHALVLPADLVRRLRAWAEAARPRETCGLLFGVRAGDVADAVPLANLAPEPDRFDLDPAGFVRADAAARERGLRVVGVWHSHPAGPPAPSAHDLAGARRGERGWSHLIVSLAPPTELASYRLSAGSMVREPVHTPEPIHP
jgi:proteasome lid subunit RPN8/RPN11